MMGVAFLRQLRCPSEHRDRDNLRSRLLAEADFAEWRRIFWIQRPVDAGC